MSRDRIAKRLPELRQIERLVEKAAGHSKITKEAQVQCGPHQLPIYSFSFGSESNVPCLMLVGGVHGLERIGTRVLIAYLESLCSLLEWDRVIQEALKNIRIVVYPLVNPGGMFLQRRSNPVGVDLMRNAPVEAPQIPSWKLFAGQRISPILPWYRGKKEAEMEVESEALCQFVERQLKNSSLAISLDVHSGFGSVDRLWFPYARSQEPFERLAEVYSLKELLDKTYPNHIYQVEPQSHQYTAHGDLWDFLFETQHQREPSQVFLPLCLELGSWQWVRKNPKQLVSALGAFNPILPHRRQRILRRHLLLFDFLLRAVYTPHQWANLSDQNRSECENRAKKQWYKKAS